MDQHSPHPPPDLAAGPVVLVGGGGHASVVMETLTLLGVQVRGLLDDASEPLLVRRGLSRLGPLSMLGSPEASDSFVLGIGDVAVRRKVLDAFADAARWISPLHPKASVSPSAAIGRGVWIGPGAIVHTAAAIGDHAIINSGAIVEHDCSIGENSHLAPACVLGGAVMIGRDTLIGLGSRVLPGVKIGEGCTIGAGAVVVADVPDARTVAGVPARPLR